MKYQENFNGSRSELADYVKKMIPELFSGKMLIEGKGVSIPQDSDLDYKVKYDENEDGGSFSFKVSWENDLPEEEEEELEIDVD